MAKLKVSLGIMTLNEIEGVKVIVPRIPKKYLYEIFCVDGGSTDGTVEWLKKHGIKVYGQKGKGRADAEKRCIEVSKGDAVIWFSPDGNEVPEDIPKLIKKMEQGNYDIVVASRFAPGANPEDAGLIHGIGNKLFTLAYNLLWGMWRGMWLHDPINGFRIIKRDCFFKSGFYSIRHEGGFELSIRATKKGFKIGEVPSDEPPRIGGKAKINTLKDGIIYSKLVLRELFNLKG